MLRALQSLRLSRCVASEEGPLSGTEVPPEAGRAGACGGAACHVTEAYGYEGDVEPLSPRGPVSWPSFPVGPSGPTQLRSELSRYAAVGTPELARKLFADPRSLPQSRPATPSSRAATSGRPSASGTERLRRTYARRFSENTHAVVDAAVAQRPASRSGRRRDLRAEKSMYQHNLVVAAAGGAADLVVDLAYDGVDRAKLTLKDMVRNQPHLPPRPAAPPPCRTAASPPRRTALPPSPLRLAMGHPTAWLRAAVWGPEHG